ncbi:MAG: stage II sporulation protein M [Actinomycetota bacterium]|nr:stage II sporulation protein M [Actinomycetota bacterium]
MVAGAWGASQPGLAALAPGMATSADLDLPGGVSAAMSADILTNNIQVTFLAFAGGITAGVLTALILVTNGALIGVLGGIALGGGNGRVFVELVVPHGVLELSCIVVAGSAGLRVGLALIDPGRRRRTDALVAEARAAAELALAPPRG